MITVESGNAFVFERMRARIATAAGRRNLERQENGLGVKNEYHLYQTFRESAYLRPPTLSITNSLNSRQRYG